MRRIEKLKIKIANMKASKEIRVNLILKAMPFK